MFPSIKNRSNSSLKTRFIGLISGKKNHTMAAAASLTQKPSSVPRQRVWFGGRSLVCIKLPNSLGKSQTIKHEV